MKRKNCLIAWSLVTATAFAAFSLPVNADDKDKDKDRYTSSDRTTKSDKAFGHIERADKLIGKEVRSSDNQKIGKLDNLVVDLESGRVLYAIVGSGGILGAGEKKFAVAPGAFEQGQPDNLRLTLDKAKFNTAPEFTKDVDNNEALAKADFINRVYEHCGQQAWWKGDKPAGEGSFNNAHKVSSLMDMNIHNVANEPMGEVHNLGIDLPAGRVVYVILEASPALNMGDKLFALPPDALTRSTDAKFLTADLTKEKLSGAPHFGKNDWPKMSDRAFASQVYQYYGKPAYFDSVQPTSDRERDRVYDKDKAKDKN